MKQTSLYKARKECGGVNRLWALGILCTSTLRKCGGGVNRLWAPDLKAGPLTPEGVHSHGEPGLHPRGVGQTRRHGRGVTYNVLHYVLFT